MKATKEEKKTILKFITYYKLQNDGNKELLRDSFLQLSGLTQNTFYYKLRHLNYKRKEIEVLADLLTLLKKQPIKWN